MVMNIIKSLATELGVEQRQIEATVRLLDEGNTVPFIARYRKEVTGALDDTQLRTLDERLGYLRELEDRRSTVLNSISEQGKLTAELKQAILDADTKTRLEDLYRPYMPKRRTKAQIAIEAGLSPLAYGLLNATQSTLEEMAAPFVDADKGVADVAAALDGARQILMEHFAEDAGLIGELREHLWQHAKMVSALVEGKEQEGAKFSDYFDFSEPLKAIPSHRVLAMFRGRKEGILTLTIVLPEDEGLAFHEPSLPERRIAARWNIHATSAAVERWLADTVRWAWKVKIFTHLDTDLKGRLREQAEEEAIRVFARNLHDLLLAAPAGQRATIGLDPGLRTGVKVAVVDSTGKLVDTATIYPHAPQNRWDDAIHTLAGLCKKHKTELVAIGNGTASRETDKLAEEIMARYPELGLHKIMVSEAGASVYSASEFAANEFPDLDVSLRGAVSIARRLQDPLAELVKIEPKAIGVGQYQHDVSQSKLSKALDAVVEDCVNAVGVDVNTASIPLLSRVAGFNTTLAANFVQYRDQHGAFPSRKAFLQVPRLGEKTFEQCAGFLRITGGENPLDASAVHPEAYPVVEKILAKSGSAIGELIGNKAILSRLAANDFADEKFGEPTVRDIISELEKPGRDPRPEFKTAKFKEGIEKLSDLKAGMILEGVVTNVTNFGCFVDIGVHQDGLVHISALADKFVKDPRDVVKAGDIVKVKVIEVDQPRKRIALSMRMTDSATDSKPVANKRSRPVKNNLRAKEAVPATGAMAEAFAKLRK